MRDQCSSVLVWRVCCAISYFVTTVLVSLLSHPTVVSARQYCETLKIPDAYDAAHRSVVTIRTTPNGQGSGVVVDVGGTVAVATNVHLVEGQDAVVVTSADGVDYETDGVLAFNDAQDLVLLAVKDSDPHLSSAELGDSDVLKPGDRVMVISTPDRDLDGTLTVGVVSAVRSGEGSLAGLQTTAAVSPGSSGGGLFDVCGELVGIVKTSLNDADEGENGKGNRNRNQNLNFAIPVSDVEELIDHVEDSRLTFSDLMDRLGLSRERVPSDPVRALARFRRGAELGDAYAQYRLGLWYFDEKEVALAEAWLRRSAEQSYADAQFLLGRMYDLRGNRAEAIELFSQAAGQDHLRAQLSLAARYGENISEKAAAGWLERLIQGVQELDEGDQEFWSEYWTVLADFSGNGRGGFPKDEQMAAIARLLAARNGNRELQFRAGEFFAGEGNGEEAIKWFRRAFDQNHPEAKAALGCMYRLGLGVARDDGLADAYGAPRECGFGGRD